LEDGHLEEVQRAGALSNIQKKISGGLIFLPLQLTMYREEKSLETAMGGSGTPLGGSQTCTQLKRKVTRWMAETTIASEGHRGRVRMEVKGCALVRKEEYDGLKTATGDQKKLWGGKHLP